MSKKGISAADKRTIIQTYFHETRTFYLQRELERISSKELKMKPEVMLEILEQLVDDGLIRKERIGHIIMNCNDHCKLTQIRYPKYFLVLNVFFMIACSN